MLWHEVKNIYRNKWIVYIDISKEITHDSLKEEKIVVIETHNNINEAYRYLCRVNRKSRNNKMRIANTREDELGFELKKTSSSYSFKRSY